MESHTGDDTVDAMWKQTAHALGFGIPEEQLERLAPVLEALWTATRQALDRDLTALEPAINFRADGPTQ
jgi:hypothetical protein